MKALNTKAKNIKLVIFDVDGVLIDGMMNYGPEGELFKQRGFNSEVQRMNFPFL